MKTVKEMVEVMQAYDRGEKIEVHDYDDKWVKQIKPNWNWEVCDYRIAKPHVPVKDTVGFPVFNDVGILKFTVDGICWKRLTGAPDHPNFRGYKWKDGRIMLDGPWRYNGTDNKIEHCDYVLMEVEK